jgi:hypothetical protein
MEDKTEAQALTKKKSVLNKIPYKEEEYQDGAAYCTKTYSFNKTIESYKINDLIKGDVSDLNIVFANEVTECVNRSIKDGTVITEQQLKFYNDCAKLIQSELKFPNPILIPVKCGFGKSAFIKAFIITLIKYINDGVMNEDALPMIISTDRREDLKAIANTIHEIYGNYHEEWFLGRKGIDEPDNSYPYIYVMEGWNESIECPYRIKSYKESVEICNDENCDRYASKQCKLSNQFYEQKNSPILAMTNDRLAAILDNKNAEDGIEKYRAFCNKDLKEIKRNILLIDEKPKLLKNNTVDIATINNLAALVDERVANNEDEKKEKAYMADELHRVLALLRKIKSDFNEYKYAFVLPNEKGLSTEFREYWKKHFKYRSWKQLNAIDDFLVNGGLFSNSTEKEYFVTTSRNLFNTSNMKTFVFDGTAELSLEYNGHSNDFIFLDIDDYKDFKNLTFHIIDENYSKTAILENPKKLDVAAKWINNTFITPTFVISHKLCVKGREKLEVNKILTGLLRNNPNIIMDTKEGKKIVPYFGNSRGKNTWRNCSVMIQIGWNRYNAQAYYAEYLSTNENVKNEIKAEYDTLKNQQESKYFNILPDGSFSHDGLETFRLLKMAVDLEQEIYRTKIRDFGNTDTPVDVYLFDVKDPLREILRQRFKGCVLHPMWNIPEFEEFKLMSRKGNEDVARLINWIDETFLPRCKYSYGKKEYPVIKLKKELDISHKRWNYLFNECELFIDAMKRRRITLHKKGNYLYLKKY